MVMALSVPLNSSAGEAADSAAIDPRLWSRVPIVAQQYLHQLQAILVTLKKQSEDPESCGQAEQAFRDISMYPGFEDSHARFARLLSTCAHPVRHSDPAVLLQQWRLQIVDDMQKVANTETAQARSATEYLLGQPISDEEVAVLKKQPDVIQYHQLLREVMVPLAQLRDQAEQPQLATAQTLLAAPSSRKERVLDIGATCDSVVLAKANLVEHIERSAQHLAAAPVPPAFQASHPAYLKVLVERRQLEAKQTLVFRDACERLRAQSQGTTGELVEIFDRLHEDAPSFDTMLENYFVDLRSEIRDVLHH